VWLSFCIVVRIAARLNLLEEGSMKKILLTSVLCLLLSACGGDDKAAQADSQANAKDAEPVAAQAAVVDKESAIEEAKKITKDFTGSLKAELKAAMQAGGPVNALSVCNTKAIPITQTVAEKYQVQLGRVSLKNRNPANVPNSWQETVLKDFDKRAAEGEDITKMAYANIVENNGKRQLRFMKAMPTGAVCLTCHGSNIDSKVQEKINQLYPDDKATGYSLGQVRGAVVIVKDLN